MARKHRKKGLACPNCGTGLQADFEYCPHCGQENHDLRVPFRRFAYEFVESLTHFDTKLWNTLKAIFTRPGQLTKDFVEGRRARHINPARFYFFVSVIFFALLTWWVDRGIEVQNAPVHGQESAVSTLGHILPDSIMEPLLNDSALVKHFYLPIDPPWYQVARKRLQGGDALLLDSLIDAADADTLTGARSRLLEALRHLPDTSSLDVLRHVRFFESESITFSNKAEQAHFMRIGANMTDLQADSILRDGQDTTSSWIKRRALRSLGRLQVGSLQGAHRLAHLVVKSVSLIMFLLMPFTAVLLLWIFYPKRYYWEHFIFSVHIHTIFFLFFSMLLVIALLIPGEWPDWTTVPVALICLVYLLLSLRHVYGKRWIPTFLRFLLMSIPYMVMFIVLLVAGFFWGFISL